MHFITYLLIGLAGNSERNYLPIAYCRHGVVDASRFSVFPRKVVVYLVLLEMFLFHRLKIIHHCFGQSSLSEVRFEVKLWHKNGGDRHVSPQLRMVQKLFISHEKSTKKCKVFCEISRTRYAYVSVYSIRFKENK